MTEGRNKKNTTTTTTTNNKKKRGRRQRRKEGEHVAGVTTTNNHSTSHNNQQRWTSWLAATLIVIVGVIISTLLFPPPPPQHHQASVNEGDNISNIKKKSPDEIYNEAVIAWGGGYNSSSNKNSNNNTVVLIDRVPYERMTHELFFSRYQGIRKPVVITGMYDTSPLTAGVDDDAWGWEAMRNRYGGVELENMVDATVSPLGCTGTGLCVGEPVKLRHLFDKYFLNKNTAVTTTATTRPPYPQDIELKKFFPEMHEVYQKSSLFGENLLLGVIERDQDRWPAMFIGAAGTQTNLHVDLMGTSFTMAVFRGRKQFLLFEAVDGPNLCMDSPNDGLDYGVGADPFQPDFDRCEQARQATALFADVRAGDILYVPGHFHHASRNLVNSIGVSQNFLSAHDYFAVMEDFGGYATRIKNDLKMKRKKERQQQQQQQQEQQHGGDDNGETEKTGPTFDEETPVTVDFLALRDVFNLLSETKFYSNWGWGPKFWNAEEASRESYKRITDHIEKVVFADPTRYATRPAYFCNIDFLVLSLKAIGAWTCLDENERRDLVDGTRDKMSTLQHLERVLSLSSTTPRTPECNRIISNFLREVNDETIPKAVSTLGRENGLTEHCC